MSRPSPRPRRGDRARVVARILLVFATAVVSVIVFTPGPPDPAGQRGLARWLGRVHLTWMPGWVTFDVVEFAANVVMFLPLGLLGALALRRRRALVILACAAFSAAVELVQRIGLPERDGSWLDIVANTLGAAIGCGLAFFVLRRLRKPTAGPASSRPGPARRHPRR